MIKLKTNKKLTDCDLPANIQSGKYYDTTNGKGRGYHYNLNKVAEQILKNKTLYYFNRINFLDIV